MSPNFKEAKGKLGYCSTELIGRSDGAWTQEDL